MSSRTTASTAATLVAIVVVIGTACWAIGDTHADASGDTAMPRAVVTVTTGAADSAVG